MGAQPDDVRGDPLQLRQDHADVRGARGHRDPHHPLHRADQRLVVGRRRGVVHAVGVRNRPVVGLALEDLLGAAVEVADDRLGVDDPLAVELHHHPQHPVRGRVLGAEGDLHLLAVGEGPRRLEVAHALPLPAGHRAAAGRVDVRVDRGAGVDPLDGEVLAQRVAVESLPGQDALQVRVVGEVDAEHVEGLALHPVGDLPHAGDGAHLDPVGDPHLEAEAPASR